ncbi:MAG: YkvA family protein [Myxococcales bacterium]|jgi:uncharacterized membrane protein YkvA (DUF1232 family)
MSSYARCYSPTKLALKCRRAAKTAGREVIESALRFHFALEGGQTPAWAQAIIVGALGYFIFPADVVPDVIPGVGYGDDLGVLSGALAAVSAFVGPEAGRRAKERLREMKIE